MARSPKPPQRVTQEQIAEQLGLSQFTVSHALRGTDKVAPETRAQIVAAAQKLGYRVNVAARATATGSTGTIALLRPDEDRAWWFPIDLFHGIESGVNNHHLRLLSARIATARLDDERFVPKILQELVADGVIVHCPMYTPPHLAEYLERYHIPAIWLNTLDAYDTVRPDDAGLTKVVVDHLISLGHQRFAFIVPQSHDAHWSSQARIDSFRAITAAAGLPDSPVITEQWSQDDGGIRSIQTITNLLKKPHRPTALIGFGPGQIPIMRAAAVEAGLLIPSDLSLAVIGNCNDQFFNDPLATTSGDINWIPMGERAVELLMKKILDPNTRFPAEAIPPKFHIGRTSATAPLTAT